MYSPIEDYAILGDMCSCALVNKQGSIDWLCWPRFDSQAVFLRLLDDDKGGACWIEGETGKPVVFLGRKYVDATNVLVTRLGVEGEDGEFTVTDFMPVRRREPMPMTGADAIAEERIVRVIRGVSGRMRVRVRVRPTFNYARDRADATRESAERVNFTGGEARLWVHGSSRVETVDESHAPIAAMTVDVEEGKVAWVVLGHKTHQACDIGWVEGREQETVHYWQTWSRGCTYQGRYREHVLRSALCMKAMTYAPSGAIVAAMTLGLPEAIGGDRNYDYRYTWLRDSSFAVNAFLNAGFAREAGEFLRFLGHAHTREGGKEDPGLRVLYDLDGAQPPKEEVLSHLKGYRGTVPVTIGNQASEQIQHEIYGELLCGLRQYTSVTGYVSPRGIELERLKRGVRRMMGRLEELWQTPDRGVWENRDGDQHFLHSKTLCWSGAECASAFAVDAEMEEAGKWAAIAKRIRGDYEVKGWNAEVGAYTQAYGSAVMDASVVRPALFGAYDVKGERLRKTVDRVRETLGAAEDASLLYRYRVPDGCEGEEGAFLACSFWMAEVLCVMGRQEEAANMYERLMRRSNDVGLFSEEIDPRTGAFLGNFPQLFTHVGVINAAVRLTR